MTTTPEPKDKLDAMASQVVRFVVNGPKDQTLDWHAVDWHAAQENVRRLRQRIFTASQAGDLRRVRNLQKLMLRSHANTLVSVRRVTEINAGRKTAGIDGEVALDPLAKAELVEWIHSPEPRHAFPVRRVFIPKAGGKEAPARNSCATRTGATSPGRQCTGTRVGGAVRAEIVRISSRPWLSGRDRSDLPSRQRC